MIHSEDDLFHTGILGMKWGVRHRNSKSSKSSNKSTHRKSVSPEEAKKFIDKQKQQKASALIKRTNRAKGLVKAAGTLITAYSILSVATMLNPRMVGDIAWTTGRIISNTPLP